MHNKVYFLQILFLLAGIYGCGEKEPLYSTPPEIDTFVQTFLKEAAYRGKNIDLYAEGLIVKFGTLPEGKAGRCRPSNFPKEVTIDSTQWKKLDAHQREVLLFHELGHCLLNRDHHNATLPYGECASLMDGEDEENTFVCSNNYYDAKWRTYYLDELFDPDTPLSDWYNIPPVQSIFFEDLSIVRRATDTCFICTPLRNFYRVSDTLQLAKEENYLISLTYLQPSGSRTLLLVWNNIAFKYTPASQRVEIVKADSFQLDQRFISLPIFAKYPNHLIYRVEDFQTLTFPVTFHLLKKDGMLYFYLNELPIHVIEFDEYLTRSPQKLQDNTQQHIILSETSEKARSIQLEVYTF